MSKEISELVLPNDVRYTNDHEWCKQKGDNVKVGITDYAQDQLGDIVFAELPEVGTSFDKVEAFGTLESVKAVTELYMPIRGEVLAVNETLADAPELVNKEPYQGGWMIEVKPDISDEFAALMTKDAYLEMLKGTE
jgi:glycine cleavage system H protein